MARNGAVQLMGLREAPVGVWVRWPGGDEQEVRLAPDTRDVTIHVPPSVP